MFLATFQVFWVNVLLEDLWHQLGTQITDSRLCSKILCNNQISLYPGPEAAKLLFVFCQFDLLVPFCEHWWPFGSPSSRHSDCDDSVSWHSCTAPAGQLLFVSKRERWNRLVIKSFIHLLPVNWLPGTKKESTFKVVIYCCEAALTYRAEAKVQGREDGEYRPAYLDLLLHRKQEDEQQ